MFGRKLLFLTVCTFLVAGLAFGQSSGNFTYGTSGNTTDCVLNDDGTITGGTECLTTSLNGLSFTCTTDADCSAVLTGGTCNTGTGLCVFPGTGGTACTKNSDCTSGLCTSAGTCALGTCGGNFFAGIKTSSGAGNVFDIRPSMVVGLLTDVVISSKNVSTSGLATSSSLAGVSVNVTIGKDGGPPVATIPNFGVTYDARYIQISTNLFNGLVANCTSNTNSGCFIAFDESTVSAHSFDWIVTNLSSGNYGITVNWASNVTGSGTFESLTCVGPVNFTVEQNKIFHQNEVNSL